jgi:hypothetical protein
VDNKADYRLDGSEDEDKDNSTTEFCIVNTLIEDEGIEFEEDEGIEFEEDEGIEFEEDNKMEYKEGEEDKLANK